MDLKKMKILRKLNILCYFFFLIFYLPFSNNKSWRMDEQEKMELIIFKHSEDI
jgi:hypothetical protein